MSLSESLDSVIATISPSWAAQRKLARVALREVERMARNEGDWGRLDTAPTARGSSADYDLELTQTRRRLVERARLADERNLLAGAILDRSVESVVGEGFRLQATTTDKAWNAQAEDLWNAFADDPAAVDTRGLLTWNELLATLYRSELRDGDVGLVLLADGTLRLVESDEIATPEGYTRPNMVDGVELDERGRPRSFHVFDRRSNMLWSDRRVAPSVEVPADQFVFCARRRRAGQTRGITSFAGMFWHLDHIDGTLEAVTVSMRMAACLGLIIKRNGGAGTAFQNLPTTTDGAGNTRRKLRMEPGGVMALDVGEDVHQVTPSHPTTPAREHIRELERLCSTRFPITLEMVLGDYTASNYSNSRNARLEARERAKIHQARLARAATTVYFWKLIGWMREKRLPLNPEALKHRWIRPGWALADPLTELQAAQAAIDSGLSTRTIEAARLGYDFEEDILPQLAKEQGLLEDAGVALVRSNLTRDPSQAPAEPQPAAAPSPAP